MIRSTPIWEPKTIDWAGNRKKWLHCFQTQLGCITVKDRVEVIDRFNNWGGAEYARRREKEDL